MLYSLKFWCHLHLKKKKKTQDSFKKAISFSGWGRTRLSACVWSEKKMKWNKSTHRFGSTPEKQRALHGFAQQKLAGADSKPTKLTVNPSEFHLQGKQTPLWRLHADRPWGNYSRSATEHFKRATSTELRQDLSLKKDAGANNNNNNDGNWRREHIGESTEHPSWPDLCSHVFWDQCTFNCRPILKFATILQPEGATSAVDTELLH